MVKLHLGCGEKIIKGYINIDSRHLPGIDLVEDIAALPSIGENSVDLIYASHVLEHFGRRIYMDVLKKWHSVLKKEGILRISVPDFKAVCEHYIEREDLSLLRGFLYGGQDYPQNYHYCCWDFKTIKDDLEKVGFFKIEKYETKVC